MKNNIKKLENIIAKLRSDDGCPWDRDLSLEKLGKLFKISKERVRQIENRAIKKLKSLVRKLSSKDASFLKIK